MYEFSGRTTKYKLSEGGMVQEEIKYKRTRFFVRRFGRSETRKTRMMGIPSCIRIVSPFRDPSCAYIPHGGRERKGVSERRATGREKKGRTSNERARGGEGGGGVLKRTDKRTTETNGPLATHSSLAMAPAASPASLGMHMLFMWYPFAMLTPNVGNMLLMTSAFVSCRNITWFTR